MDEFNTCFLFDSVFFAGCIRTTQNAVSVLHHEWETLVDPVRIYNAGWWASQPQQPYPDPKGDPAKAARLRDPWVPAKGTVYQLHFHFSKQQWSQTKFVEDWDHWHQGHSGGFNQSVCCCTYHHHHLVRWPVGINRSSRPGPGCWSVLSGEKKKSKTCFFSNCSNSSYIEVTAKMMQNRTSSEVSKTFVDEHFWVTFVVFSNKWLQIKPTN